MIPLEMPSAVSEWIEWFNRCMYSAVDHQFMSEALAEAQKALYLSNPNPRVGCVIVKDGEIIGRGFTQKVGAAHAEVQALADVQSKGKDPAGSTIYVTLEPCNHTGKTPPCVDLIIQHKIKKVVIASLDPNPKVSSVEKLKAAGIEVEVMNEPSAIILNKRFFTQHNQHRPYFILKTASTIDGKIADRNHKSKWISNAHSRQFVHAHLRSNTDAILTRYKTVLEDEKYYCSFLPAKCISSLASAVADHAPFLSLGAFRHVPHGTPRKYLDIENLPDREHWFEATKTELENKYRNTVWDFCNQAGCCVHLANKVIHRCKLAFGCMDNDIDAFADDVQF